MGDAAERARIVAAYDITEIRERGDLDDLAAFAGELCDAPIALISIVGEETQHFAAHVGVALETTPRDLSFCAHALGDDVLLEVTDPRTDPRFADNPLVTDAPFIRFYAGMPLVSHDGVTIGTICVIDTEPRAGLDPFQRRGLAVLAKATMARLDDRRLSRERVEIQARHRRIAEESDAKFRLLADTMPQMVWSTLPDGFHDYYNARWYDFTGTPPGSTDGDGWNGVFHPDDQDRAWATWRHSLETGEPYEIEYRLRHFDGTYRWVLGRALAMRGEDGTIQRWFGTCTDIHEQKLAMEEREVISQELSHRIKNIFSVIAGLVGFAARSKPEFAAIATDLRQRITALGRAHDFVRPHSAQSRPSLQQDSLHGLLVDLFEPYQTDDAGRMQVTGDDVMIDDRSATPLALLFHELATNATKYGALSTDTGRVAITIAARDDMVAVNWTERGGPPVEREPVAGGFGSQLVELSAVRQLGGKVVRDWRPEGLDATITIPVAALRR